MQTNIVNPRLTVQPLSIEQEDLKFQCPFAMSINGPSQSGKSDFIVKLIKNKDLLISSKFEKIFYCTPESLFVRPNDIFEKLRAICPEIQHLAGLPDYQKLNLTQDKQHKLLIIDDLMNEFLSSELMVQLLSVDVHHFNISCIFTLQNFYAPSKFGTTIAKNLNYRVIFQNRLDLRETRNISLQICNKPNFLSESFEFLLSEFPDDSPYLILDGHLKNKHKSLFVKSHIFPTKKFNLHDRDEIKPLYFFPK